MSRCIIFSMNQLVFCWFSTVFQCDRQCFIDLMPLLDYFSLDDNDYGCHIIVTNGNTNYGVIKNFCFFNVYHPLYQFDYNWNHRFSHLVGYLEQLKFYKANKSRLDVTEWETLRFTYLFLKNKNNMGASNTLYQFHSSWKSQKMLVRESIAKR